MTKPNAHNYALDQKNIYSYLFIFIFILVLISVATWLSIQRLTPLEEVIEQGLEDNHTYGVFYGTDQNWCQPNTGRATSIRVEALDSSDNPADYPNGYITFDFQLIDQVHWDQHLDDGQIAYNILTRDLCSNIWYVESTTTSIPTADQTFIKGVVKSTGFGTQTLSFGIERHYQPAEVKRGMIYGGCTVTAEIELAADGTPSLKQFYYGTAPWPQIPAEFSSCEK